MTLPDAGAMFVILTVLEVGATSSQAARQQHVSPTTAIRLSMVTILPSASPDQLGRAQRMLLDVGGMKAAEASRGGLDMKRISAFASALMLAAVTIACSSTDAGITTNVKSKMAADDTVK